MAMRMVPPGFCVFGVGGEEKEQWDPQPSVALVTYSTVPGACEKSRPSSRRCTPVPRNTGLYVLSMKTVTLAVSPAWRGGSFMRVLWATVGFFCWNGLVGFGSSAVASTTAQACQRSPFSVRRRRVTSLTTRNIESVAMVMPKLAIWKTKTYQFDLRPSAATEASDHGGTGRWTWPWARTHAGSARTTLPRIRPPCAATGPTGSSPARLPRHLCVSVRAEIGHAAWDDRIPPSIASQAVEVLLL